MDEKIIIEGKIKTNTRVLAALVASGFILSFVILMILRTYDFYLTTMHYILFWVVPSPLYVIGPVCLWLGVLFAIIMIVELIMFKNISIVVTDKRVYGTAAWSKRVDLPFDMISAVGTSAMKGIDVSTSSGVVKFKFIANNNEIHEAISKILLERQGKEKTPNATAPAQTVVTPTSADELKKYKELLDSGVITQAEFDAKKKQILGL